MFWFLKHSRFVRAVLCLSQRISFGQLQVNLQEGDSLGHGLAPVILAFSEIQFFLPLGQHVESSISVRDGHRETHKHFHNRGRTPISHTHFMVSWRQNQLTNVGSRHLAHIMLQACAQSRLNHFMLPLLPLPAKTKG